MRYIFWVMLLVMACTLAPAQGVGGMISRDNHIWQVRVASADGLRLVGQAPGDPRDFAGLGAWALSRGLRVSMAMNAGIFETVADPTGLFVEDGVVYSPLELKDARGNFFLKPNGVFYVDGEGGHIVESSHYAPDVRVALATQSGPLLVADGMLHPALDPGSLSRTVRNGVGIRADGQVVLGVSLSGTNLYEMATFFRDELGCPDVLYLDGSISRMCVGEVLGCVSGEFSGMLVVVE